MRRKKEKGERGGTGGGVKGESRKAGGEQEGVGRKRRSIRIHNM